MAAVPSRGRAGSVEAIPAEAAATRALYERYSVQLHGYCLNQLGSPEEAEDAVQSTFLNAFRGLSRGIVPEAESAWLFKIAENVCLSRRRSSWRRGRVEAPTDFEIAADLMPAPSRRADELIGLQDVLGQMPEGQRRAILLREWQGLSYHEIAAELELSQAAVETLIFRARRSLAQGLEASPAEQRSWRQRVRSSVDLGSLVGILKSLLASGAAVKMGTAAAVVAVSSVAASVPSVHRSPAPPAAHHGAPVGHKTQASVRARGSLPRHVAPAQQPRRRAHAVAPLRSETRPVTAAPRVASPAPTRPAAGPPADPLPAEQPAPPAPPQEAAPQPAPPVQEAPAPKAQDPPKQPADEGPKTTKDTKQVEPPDSAPPVLGVPPPQPQATPPPPLVDPPNPDSAPPVVGVPLPAKQ